MSSWTNLSIRMKVLIAFGAVFLATCTLGIFGLIETSRINDDALDIRDDWLPSTGALGNLAISAENYRIIEARLIIAAVSKDAANLDRKSTRLNSSHSEISRMPSSA